MSEVFNSSVLDAINRAVQDGISTTALEVDGTPQYCIINAETREIEIPGELNIFGVESDEKSTRVYFRCPKYVGTNVDIDITQCMVYVPYRNANGEKDQYIVTDLNETEDGENVEFTWLISRKASAYMGITEFGIRAIKTATGGTIEAEWNTTVASANVIRGMDVGLLEFSEENKDALAQALDLINQELEQTKNEMNSAIEAKGQQTLASIPEDYTQLQADVDGLSEDMDQNGFRSIVYIKENVSSSVSFTLLKYDAKIGDIIWFDNISNRCVNLLAKYTDGSEVILINGLNPSIVRSITVEKDIQYFGLFLYDYDVMPDNEIVIINVFNDNTYKKIYNQKNAEDIAKNAEDIAKNAEDIAKNAEDIAKNAEDISSLKFDKVNGMLGWSTDRYVRVEGHVYNRSGQVFSLANGDYSYAELSQNDTKVKISGYGWDYSFNYRLYVFYDVEGSVLSESDDTYHQKTVNDLELSIPKGAVRIVVNGKDYKSKIEVYGDVVSFEECYQMMKDVEPQEPIKYFKLITLGDSITMLGTGERGWIKYFIEKTNAELIVNVAMNSAVLKDYSNTVYDGDPQQSNQDNNVLGNQVQKILNNDYEAPDVIMIAIGTNSGINITEDSIKQAYYGDGNTLITLSSIDRTTDAGAYRYCLETLHNKYPDAVIIWCTPIMGYESTRSAKNAMAYGKSLKIATQYSGQLCCDTMRCGINGVNEKQNENGEYLIDGLHPNVNGAKKIGYFNANFVNQHLYMINLQSE